MGFGGVAVGSAIVSLGEVVVFRNSCPLLANVCLGTGNFEICVGVLLEDGAVLIPSREASIRWAATLR